MTESSINEHYQSIVSLLIALRLNEALTQLDALLYNCDDVSLRPRLEQINTSYQYMLQYMRNGMYDPERPKLYRQLLAQTWNLADEARINALDIVSLHYYHTARRKAGKDRLTALVQNGRFPEIQKTVESFADDVAVSKLMEYKGIEQLQQRREEADRDLFITLWTNSSWSNEESAKMNELLQSETMPEIDLCLFVSAVFLSLMECFDDRKIDWMISAAQHRSRTVSQRAAVQLVILIQLFADHLLLYSELTARLSLYEEDAAFIRRITVIYLQLLRSQETEGIDKKMREEIFPEMMRKAGNLHRPKKENDENDENDVNPDWEEWMEQSGLSEQIRKITELQMEGADIYLSTFAPLKKHPFYSQPGNWFMPFDNLHSAVFNQLQLENQFETHMIDLFLQTGMLCNNDKYSFAFSLKQIPKDQRRIIIDQMAPEAEESVRDHPEFYKAIKAKYNTPEVISNQYIQDLYRFYVLNPRRSEFRNPFKEKFNLFRNPILKKFLREPDQLPTIAEYLFRKERHAEALEIYQELIEQHSADANIYQKAGFCLQKEKRYREAVEFYLAADSLKPAHLWTLRHIATCYRLLKEYAEALTYYRRIEEINPEDQNTLFYVGLCCAETKQYNDALNYFFKLDYIEGGNVRAERAIGWYSFITGKHQQAMKYYNKVLADKPLTTDYLNAGHVAWALGKPDQAATLYARAVQASGSKDAFLRLFHNDREILIEQGISEEDIPLMADLV
ncbi:MAG: tetratricopeptide repeat protein [Prevotellaceae bacterium]|jgi:tetratricopeptide (TPR) repeat protein|nr:tetratricopeptide repeat protein [Prevotellaceae bacterium]